MNNIFIIDIDGCILDDIFINFNNKLPISYINGRLEFVKLWNDFLDFLKYVKKDDKIYFLTGRKEKELGFITKKQLKSLKNMLINFEIIFYPNNLEITKNNYFNYKSNNCNLIIQKNWDKNILIIDDKNDYFTEIYYRNNVKTFQIKKENDWILLLNLLKNV